jgi:hypothetical protein
MEAQSKSEEFKRINLIAASKIPVSEESPLFGLFYQRREVARNMKYKNAFGDNREYGIKILETFEEKIKEYLYL